MAIWLCFLQTFKLMKIILLYFIGFLPLLADGQEKSHQGIHFETTLNWQQIKEKAISEHKSIFVDCYATWCGPCKMMDMQTYPDSIVGNYFNQHYISVKIQCDSTKSDNAYIRSWYPDTKKIVQKYSVFSYPTFLFFSPTGALLYRDAGFYNSTSFLALAQNAVGKMNELLINKQNFYKKELPFSKIPAFVDALRAVNDDKEATIVAAYYVHDYLLKLPKDTILKKGNVTFIANYLCSSPPNQQIYKDEAYHFFEKNVRDVNKIMQSGYGTLAMKIITWKHGVEPIIKASNANPNWKSIFDTIKNDFGQKYAELGLLNAKFNYYSFVRLDRAEQIKAKLDMEDKFGLDTAGFFAKAAINNFCFAVILKYSDNKNELTHAISDMKVIINNENNPILLAPWLDTEANLYYKLNERNKAISLEKEALKFDRKYAKQNKREPNPNYSSRVLKMQKGEKLW